MHIHVSDQPSAVTDQYECLEITVPLVPDLPTTAQQKETQKYRTKMYTTVPVKFVLQEAETLVLCFRGYAIACLSGVPDYFGRNKISSGGDLSHCSSASLY